jgi:cell division septation protein DedD/uncharacterized membrane protein required for colicin V production
MEETLKARLIGAAVLVALAVLLIPELLSGRKAVEPVAEEGTGQRGTRTFTIELGQGPGQATRSQPISTATAPTPAAVASTEVPADAKAAAEVPVEPQVEPTAETPTPVQAEAAAPATTPAKAVQEPKSAPATAETAPAAARAEPQPPPALTAGGGWAVQVGAFSSTETARKLVKDLGGAGYRAFVSPVSKGGKTLYRVRVGPEADKAGAEQLAQRLKARGLPATVVRTIEAALLKFASLRRRSPDSNCMTPVDYILAATVCLSVLFGAVRGFLRESVALLGWLVGLWLAWRYAYILEPYLGGALEGTELQSWAARAIVLLAVVIASWILGGLLSYLVQRSGLTLGVDRLLGGLFGLVRGAVIVGFTVMLGEAAELQGETWWRESKLMPVGQEMAGVLRGYVETGRKLVADTPPDA